jgi:hypothetical protein
VPVRRRGGYDGELAIRVVRDGDARVVLTGLMDPAACRLVHDALVVLLRDVDRVLVDIAGLTLTRASLLHVFPDALDAAGGWPAVRLGLVYRGEVMRQALHASRVTRRVAVADQPDLALRRCAEQPGEGTGPVGTARRPGHAPPNPQHARYAPRQLVVPRSRRTRPVS